MSILISHFGCHACNTASMCQLFPDSTGCGVVVHIRQAGEELVSVETLWHPPPRFYLYGTRPEPSSANSAIAAKNKQNESQTARYIFQGYAVAIALSRRTLPCAAQWRRSGYFPAAVLFFSSQCPRRLWSRFHLENRGVRQTIPLFCIAKFLAV